MRSEFMAAAEELKQAIGPWSRLKHKLVAIGNTAVRVLAFRKRRKRLERLKAVGRIDSVPTEWQIYQASYVMFADFILPSNDEFYEHYSQDMYWYQLLRLLDEPSVFMDPTGLSVPRDVLIRHILHVVHTSAGYDIELLDTYPGGLDELERQLKLLTTGRHPDQAELDELIERPDYHTRLLKALKKYLKDPVKHWRVITYTTPEGCEETFDAGIERFGSLGRLMRYAAGLPRTPYESLQAYGWLG